MISRLLLALHHLCRAPRPRSSSLVSTETDLPSLASRHQNNPVSDSLSSSSSASKMFSPQWSSRLALAVTFLVVCVSQGSAATVEYCSTLNTASTDRNSSMFQSDGLCSDFCKATYAFAVLQGDGCWCSNFAPASTTTGCDTPCSGFPSDICGGNGLFGYIALGINPSGTQGGSSTIPSSTQPASSTVQQSSDTPSPTTQPSSIITQTSQSSTSTSPSITWTPTPVVSLETLTGQVRTVTVTPTVPPATENTQTSQNVNAVSKGSGLGTGGAVGLTVGLVALVAVIGAMVFYCFKKRRQEKEAEEYNNLSRRGSSSGFGGPAPSRTMSENSRYVLGTNGRHVVETWEPEQDAPGSRNSRLMPVDPRLDPFAPVYQRGENKSRESVNTIRDDHDYSRRVHQQGPILRATNPDTDN